MQLFDHFFAHLKPKTGFILSANKRMENLFLHHLVEGVREKVLQVA
jgi:hypothetical protein